MGDNLKQKTIKAVTWSSIDRFGQQGIQFIIALILARHLSRADYGLIGSVAVFSSLAIIFVESGFSQALIRKQDADETDYNTVFIFNLIISIVLYFILFFSAPYISEFYRQPQLATICQVLFLGLPINALYLVPLTQLTKALDFKTIAKSNISAVLISGSIGITLALNKYGVWSLVIQQVIFHLVRLLFFHFSIHWKPKLLFSFQVIRNFWSFSINVLGTSVLNAFFNNIYNIILGRFYNIQQLGDYTQANKLSETFNYSFLVILTSSSYPVFVQVQHDENRFRQIYRELVKKSSIVTFPVLITLIAIAYPLIPVLLSDKWIQVVPYFQLVCSASLFAVLYSLTINALNARGKSGTTFRLELIKKGLILASVLVCFKFGISAMLIGYVVASYISYLISILYLKREINHYIKHQISDFIKPLLIGIAIGVCCYAVSFLINNTYILLAVQLLTAFVLYLLSIKLFYNEIYIESLHFIESKIAQFLKKDI